MNEYGTGYTKKRAHLAVVGTDIAEAADQHNHLIHTTHRGCSVWRLNRAANQGRCNQREGLTDTEHSWVKDSVNFHENLRTARNRILCETK